MATYRTGGEIDALCNKCKLTLAHTILAMVGDKVVRVQCNTCRSQHAFRGATAPSASPRPRATTSRSTAGSTAAVSKITQSFEQLLGEKDASKARRYSPKDTYAKDDLIEHPTFGYGIVMEVRVDKVQVLFKMDEKTLVHGRGGAPVQKPSFQASRATHAGSSDAPPSENAEPSEGDSSESEASSEDGASADESV